MNEAQPKPDYVRPAAETIPDELKQIPAWVLWRASWSKDRGKWTKVPYSVHTLRPAKSNDADTWGEFAAVFTRYQAGGFDGVGYVLHAGDNFAGIDLDHCRQIETGEIKPWAQVIIQRLDSYTEVSPSGTGIRIFIKATLPKGRRKRGDIEFYDQGRYLTVTGSIL